MAQICGSIRSKLHSHSTTTQVLTLTADGATVSSQDLLLLTKKPLSAACLSSSHNAPALPTLRTLGLVVEASSSHGVRELQVRERVLK